jgi:hypothetical protein
MGSTPASKSKRALLDAAWAYRKQGMSLAAAVDRALRDAGYRAGKSGQLMKGGA